MRWPKTLQTLAVGAFIAYHLVGVTLGSIPAPEGGMDRAAWSDPTVQREFQEWTSKLDALGLQLNPRQFEDSLWELGSRYMRLRGEVLRPWTSYFEWAGTLQSWRMFVAPHRYPSRLVVDIQEHGTWRTVFSERSSTATWQRAILGDYRFRSIVFRVSWPAYEGQFHDLVHWLAVRAAVDFPEAQRISVQMVRSETPPPADLRAGRAPPRSVGPDETVDLDALR